MSKPALAEVVTLHPCLDVVAMLREMADNIEKGNVAPVRSIGVLHLGIERLTRMRLRQFESEA